MGAWFPFLVACYFKALYCSKNSINLSVAAFYSLERKPALLWEMQVLQGGEEAVTAPLKTQLHVQSFLRIAFGSAQGRAACANSKCASVSSVPRGQSWLLLVGALIQVRWRNMVVEDWELLVVYKCLCFLLFFAWRRKKIELHLQFTIQA